MRLIERLINRVREFRIRSLLPRTCKSCIHWCPEWKNSEKGTSFNGTCLRTESPYYDKKRSRITVVCRWFEEKS